MEPQWLLLSKVDCFASNFPGQVNEIVEITQQITVTLFDHITYNEETIQ